MRIVLALVLLTGLAVVRDGAQEKLPAKPTVVVLKADAVIGNAIKQVTSASPELGEDVSTAVSSLEAGLPHVQKMSDLPILAMAEREGWFVYATSLVRDSKTGAPLTMLAGYAIKRDGRRVIGWGAW
jgi:hypothetical protein